jgi:glycosyltransferase involved in cell wall biosynthesis
VTPRPVHQLLSSVAPGDAVTGQAFAWQELLHEWGHPSEIVAEHVHPDLESRARRLDQAGRLLDDANLILRYSIWSRTIDVALSARGRVGLVYHNITPGELLREHHPTLADLCDRGRGALTRFRDVFDVVVADSSFNAADLEEAGVEGATVIPLLLDLPARVERREPRSSTPVVLSVGRLAPNKRLEDAIKAFTLFQRHHAPDASLVLVGTNVGDTYRPALEHLVSEIGVENVTFTGAISSRARDSWYRRADAYLAMSVHEGFCAPLLEALAHGAPVVARSAGAVPETLGGAGLLVDGDLALAAECLHEVTTSLETRAGLADAAERRLAELRPELIRPRIRSALEPLLESQHRGS